MTSLEKFTLSLFETNKQQRLSFVEQTIQQIEEGNINPLQVHLQVKAMEDIITLITSTDKKKNPKGCMIANRYQKALMEEADKHGKSFEYHSAKITQREVGTKYDFSECNDPVLMVLEFDKSAVDLKVKERQDFLKTVPISGLEILSEDGEIVTVYPPKKTSTTSLIVTLQ